MTEITKEREVLLVEDNAFDAEYVKKLFKYGLQDDNIFLKHEETLKGATKAIEDHRPDLVILDLHLPDSEGKDTFVAIHQRFPTIPILILSANNDEKVAAGILKMGAQDYLVKGSFSDHILKKAIQYAIQSKYLEEELKDYQRRYMEIFNNSYDPIYISDDRGNIISCNDATLNLLNYDSKAIKKVNIRDLYIDQRDKKRLKEAIKYNFSIRDMMTTIMKSDGSTIRCIASISAQKNKIGKVVGYHGTFKRVA